MRTTTTISTPARSSDPEDLLGLAEVLHGRIVLAGLVVLFAALAQRRHLVAVGLRQARLGRELGVDRLHLVRAVVGPGGAREGDAGCKDQEFAHGTLHEGEAPTLARRSGGRLSVYPIPLHERGSA